MNRIQSLAFIVAAGAAVVFCLCFALHGVAADSSLQTIVLEQKINPNDAAPASLVRLPGVGPARAQAIVSYREEYKRSGSGDLAFRNCFDLQNVKGIGPGVADDMCRYLEFDGE